MDFDVLYKIENETERVQKTYELFNEDTRLNHSKAARVEFFTTVCYIEKYLKQGAKILDVGAGAGEYNKETFRLEDFPFVFHTVDAARKVLADGKIKVLHEVASDGVSELLEDKINAMDDASYEQYLRYHYYICEKKEFLGMTNHLLFVGEKE